MPAKIQTSVEIAAPSTVVRQILMDFTAYPEWNPFIKKITGNAHIGTQIEAHIQPPGGSLMVFKPTVTVNSDTEFRWKGKLLFNGLFDGEHYFIITGTEPKGCKFEHGENFTGALVGLFSLMGVLKKTERGFTAMNEALKKRTEEKAGKGDVF